jgi:hypothetical protein
VFESGRNSDGSPRTDRDEEAMVGSVGSLNNIGKEVLANPRGKTRFEISSEIKWDEMSDTPYVSYVWDEVRWANIIETSFKKGMDKVKLVDLSEAVRNLRFDHKTKMNLLKIFYGISPNSSDLTYNHGPLAWNGVLSGVKSAFPNFFLEK